MSSSPQSGSPRLRPRFLLRYRGMGGAVGVFHAERVEVARVEDSARWELVCSIDGRRRSVRLEDLVGIEVVLSTGEVIRQGEVPHDPRQAASSEIQ